MISVSNYKMRQGRMLPPQRRALDRYWHDYGIDQNSSLDLESLFGRKAPCHLEIGFGMGDALLEMAASHPEYNYLGVEVYLTGVGHVLRGIRDRGITNVRIDRRDAMEVLDLLPARSIGRVCLFFPDPWPKRKHHKRRLVQPPFLVKLERVLLPGGCFHVATDWDDYARQILETMEGAEGFTNSAECGGFYSGPVERPLTKFEKRGLRQGHMVRDLLFERDPRALSSWAIKP